MSKGNSGLLSKHQSKLSYSGAGIIGDPNGYEVLKEVVLRVKTREVSSKHIVSIEGRISLDSEWEEIGTLKGVQSSLIHIASWDYIRFVCLDYRPFSTGSDLEIISSAFFNDGLFITNAINDLKDSLNSGLHSISQDLKIIKREIEILNDQMETITDYEKEELK